MTKERRGEVEGVDVFLLWLLLFLLVAQDRVMRPWDRQARREVGG